MEWYMYPAVVGIGLMAGFINTLAGGGSALSLPFLIFLGLPANVANGTNRIAILFQTAAASRTYRKNKVLDLRKGIILGLVSLAGAAIGARIAVDLNEQVMRRVVGTVLVIMFLLVIFKPGLWLRQHTDGQVAAPVWISWPVFFLIGAYGGFIQVGTGFFMLAGLVLAEKQDLVRANALKVFLILIYTPVALLIFILNDQVDYRLGLVLAVGNTLGAWLGSKVAVSWGPKLIRWILLIALAGSILKLFDIM